MSSWLYSTPASFKAARRSTSRVAHWPEPEPPVIHWVADQPKTFTLLTSLLSGRTLSSLRSSTVPSAWICSARVLPACKSSSLSSARLPINWSSVLRKAAQAMLTPSPRTSRMQITARFSLPGFLTDLLFIYFPPSFLPLPFANSAGAAFWIPVYFLLPASWQKFRNWLFFLRV